MPYYTGTPEPGDESQRLCAREAWCTGYRLVPQGDGTSRREPGLTYQEFCPADVKLIGERLSELPAAYRRLEADLGDPVRRAEMIRVPFGPKIPLSEHYDMLMRRMAESLAWWEGRVRTEARLSSRPPQRMPRAGGVKFSRDGIAVVTAAVVTLERHLSVLFALAPVCGYRHITAADLRTPLWQDAEVLDRADGMVTLRGMFGGALAGNEILDLHRRCESALGEVTGRPEVLDGIPCRSCEAMGLVRAEPPTGKQHCKVCRLPVELAAAAAGRTGETWKHAAGPVPSPHDAVPERPAMYSQCPRCKAEMDLKTYLDWTDWYGAWAESAGPLTCQRCLNGDCEQCVYPGCECLAGGHAAAALVA